MKNPEMNVSSLSLALDDYIDHKIHESEQRSNRVYNL